MCVQASCVGGVGSIVCVVHTLTGLTHALVKSLKWPQQILAEAAQRTEESTRLLERVSMASRLAD